ncbi:hypothetical protein [Nocardia wallacei]|uniref:glycine-rich domain-containing protein n=1 Tax=Nocardia wallacei TaxID=480035 RepID=UPI002455AE76|nr:hypothetical protein [Nocardia wallacei]
MTSPDQSPVPSETQGETVGGWGFDDLIDALLGGWLTFIGAQIAGALRDLADKIGDIPIVGDALEDILDGLADWIGGVNETAQTAQQTAVNAASKVNFTEIYNFETAEIRDKYPANGGVNGFSYTNEPGIASSGTWALKLQPSAGYAANAAQLLSQPAEVASGETLYIEWRQRRFGTPNFRASILMYFYDAAGGFLSFGNTYAIPPLTADEGEWNTYAAQVIPPTGAVKADVRAVLYEPAGLTPTAASGWYFEDVVAGRVAMQSSVRGLQQDLATAISIAESANAAIGGMGGVVLDHENRITYLESGNQVAEVELNDDWHKPGAMSYHKAILVGGAGGACGGCTGAGAPAGYGGGCGGWAEDVWTSAELDSIVPVTLGVGGGGGARRNGAFPDFGDPGTATSFGSYLTAGGGSGGNNNNPPIGGTGTRTDFQPHGGRGAGVTGDGSPGGNGYLCAGGPGGTGNGGAGGTGNEPPPGQYGPGSGGGGGAGNSAGGGDSRGGDGGYPGGGGGAGGGAVNWVGLEQGGAGGKGGNGKAWIISSPGVLT